MASSDDEQVSQAVGRAPRQRLFSSDEESDDGGRGHVSEAEEDNRYNRREGGGDRNTDEEDEEEARKREEKKRKEEAKKKKPKGPVRRQMISEDMLTGKKGISTLPDLFSDVKLGGKGQERQDLDKVLSKLEYWIHLLHPKQPFDQSLQRIEFLGLKKKVVKTHLKKIRMGMVENLVEDEVLLNDEDDVMRIGDEDANEEEAMPSEATIFSGLPSSSEVAGTSSAPAADEFPDEDDDFFEMVDESQIRPEITEEEMDVEDIPPMNEDDEEEDFVMKQMQAQMKRAEEEAKRREEETQLIEPSTSQTNPGTPPQETEQIKSPEKESCSPANLEEKVEESSGEAEKTVVVAEDAKATDVTTATAPEDDDEDGIMLDDIRDDNDD